MSTLAQTRDMLAADLKRNPHLKAHGRKLLKNLAILASDADDEAKAAVLKIMPANVERFRAARNR
jgi:hypothetical protein